jgi:hypothetical protein
MARDNRRMEISKAEAALRLVDSATRALLDEKDYVSAEHPRAVAVVESHRKTNR